MKIARTIGLGLGVVVLLAVGAASLSRAQQPKGTTVVAPSQARGELRERVLKLKTDVDLLQLEFDAARATLLEALKKSGERDLGGDAELAEIRAGLESFRMMVLRDSGADAEKVNKFIKAVESSDSARGTEEEFELIKDSMKFGGVESEAATDKMAQLELKKRTEASRVAIDRQKKEFARIARTLNEKKLDLAEAEKQYQLEAR